MKMIQFMCTATVTGTCLPFHLCHVSPAFNHTHRTCSTDFQFSFFSRICQLHHQWKEPPLKCSVFAETSSTSTGLDGRHWNRSHIHHLTWPNGTGNEFQNHSTPAVCQISGTDNKEEHLSSNNMSSITPWKTRWEQITDHSKLLHSHRRKKQLHQLLSKLPYKGVYIL